MPAIRTLKTTLTIEVDYDTAYSKNSADAVRMLEPGREVDLQGLIEGAGKTIPVRGKIKRVETEHVR